MLPFYAQLGIGLSMPVKVGVLRSACSDRRALLDMPHEWPCVIKTKSSKSCCSQSCVALPRIAHPPSPQGILRPEASHQPTAATPCPIWSGADRDECRAPRPRVKLRCVRAQSRSRRCQDPRDHMLQHDDQVLEWRPGEKSASGHPAATFCRRPWSDRCQSLVGRAMLGADRRTLDVWQRWGGQHSVARP